MLRQTAAFVAGSKRWPPAIVLSLAWILFVLAIALLCQWLAPFDPTDANLRSRFERPFASPTHWLGTDHLGRDMWSRLMYASRTSILVAMVGTLTGAAIGTMLGILAAHRRGWIDAGVSMSIDVQASIPFTILSVAAIALLGGSFGVLLVLLGLYHWERYARLARSLTLASKNNGYATAAVLYGASWPYVYVRHVLPNISSALLVQMTFNFPQIIILESALSFLGVGVQPPNASLGSMLNEGRVYLLGAPWIAVIPGLFILATALAVTMLGDYLRDRLDPATTRGVSS